MTEASIGSSGVAKILLSRFNLYIPSFRKMSGIDGQGYENWCRRRVELFQKYTLPSVIGQDSSHFQWLIYFDTEMNDPIAELLNTLKGLAFVHPILIDLRGKSVVEDLVGKIQQDLLRIIPKGARYVCTTRLDTDDALGMSFIKNLDHHLHRLKTSVYCEDKYALTFPFGCQILGDAVNAYVYDRNPFITLIEKLPTAGAANPPRSVLSFAHYAVEQVATLYRALETNPQWLQVIHDGNAANEFKQDLPRLVEGQISKWFVLA